MAVSAWTSACQEAHGSRQVQHKGGVEWGDEGGYKDEDRQIGGEGSSYPAYWHIYPISLSRPDVPAWISMDLCQ